MVTEAAHMSATCSHEALLLPATATRRRHGNTAAQQHRNDSKRNSRGNSNSNTNININHKRKLSSHSNRSNQNYSDSQACSMTKATQLFPHTYYESKHALPRLLPKTAATATPQQLSSQQQQQPQQRQQQQAQQHRLQQQRQQQQ